MIGHNHARRTNNSNKSKPSLSTKQWEYNPIFYKSEFYGDVFVFNGKQ